MTPQELKTSILTLAMKGMLTSSNEWIDEGTDTIFKSLWEVTAWDKKFKNVEKHKQKKVVNYAYVLAGDFQKLERPEGDVLLLSTGNYIGYTTEEVGGDLVREGEVVTMPWGGHPFIKYYKGKFITSDNRIATSLDTSCLSNKYLYYYMLSKVDYLETLYRGTSLRHPVMALVLEMRIPIPSIEEQNAIVSKIEELLPLVDRYEKAWTELDDLNKRLPLDMQKSILQMAIRGKLVSQNAYEGTGEELYKTIQAEKVRLTRERKIKNGNQLPEITDDEMPFDIPESWKWVRLGEVVQFQGGYAYKSTSYVQSSQNQVIRLGNVKLNKLLLDSKQVFIPDEVANATEDYLIRANDILVTMTGTRKKRDYFFTLMVSQSDIQDIKLYLNQRVGCLRPFNSINVSYLLYVLQSEAIKDLIFAKETGTANQGNIGSEDIKSCILVPLPPLAEQRRIVEKLEELLPICERLKTYYDVNYS